MDPLNLKKLNAARRARQAVALVTSIADGRDRIVLEGDPVGGELGEALGKAFRSGKSTMVTADGAEFFINVHLPPARIVVIGAVHISQALAPMAKIAGFDIEIIDPRTAFASPERFEGVTLHADWPQNVLPERPFDAWTAVAAVTHDPKIDDPALEAALKAGCFYIGALGSRKTHARRVERLTEAGFTADEIGRIAAPIGLDIGAASPAEIAVAVLAQIIRALRTRGLAGPRVQKGEAA
ncbi:MAG: XdhC/CoxF family protein [Phyllobacteriaceae bacterium]|nr:XdhC/CoxF family protein [Phyllobacteriaceae bacterium]MBA90344.1 XdhC/CoxF family protein [Phyllobacteriaceae bacterium]